MGPLSSHSLHKKHTSKNHSNNTNLINHIDHVAYPWCSYPPSPTHLDWTCESHCHLCIVLISQWFTDHADLKVTPPPDSSQNLNAAPVANHAARPTAPVLLPLPTLSKVFKQFDANAEFMRDLMMLSLDLGTHLTPIDQSGKSVAPWKAFIKRATNPTSGCLRAFSCEAECSKSRTAVRKLVLGIAKNLSQQFLDSHAENEDPSPLEKHGHRVHIEHLKVDEGKKTATAASKAAENELQTAMRGEENMLIPKGDLGAVRAPTQPFNLGAFLDLPSDTTEEEALNALRANSTSKGEHCVLLILLCQNLTILLGITGNMNSYAPVIDLGLLPDSGDEGETPELSAFIKQDMKAREEDLKKKRATASKTTSKTSDAAKMTKKQRLALESKAKVKGQRDLAKLAAGTGSRPLDHHQVLDAAFGHCVKSVSALDKTIKQLAPDSPPPKSPNTIKKESIFSQMEKLSKLKAENPQLADDFTNKIKLLLDQV